ncbi:MAG: DUF1772 domain-containing protein [Acidimicrobiales bacterium]
MTVRAITLFLGLMTSGLMAGLFFGWLVSVIPGLAKVSDSSYVSTMQNINREIINPVFVATFMLTPVVLGVAAIVHFQAGHNRRAWWLAAAAATYVVGVLGVTVGGNIALNNQLDAFDTRAATDVALGERRSSYEGPWNRWHSLRTLASIGSLALASIAAIVEAGE